MYYVYILRSLKDKKFYIGYTNDLRRRFKEHNDGKVTSKKYRMPFEILYYEACRNQDDALHREKYLKSTYGHKYINNRLKNDLV